MSDSPYNPLDKANLAKCIKIELLARPPVPLSAAGDIKGAGIYVIYYVGKFSQLCVYRREERGWRVSLPIYIGKAIPKGGRKGGLSADASKGRALADRLAQHAASIEQGKQPTHRGFSCQVPSC